MSAGQDYTKIYQAAIAAMTATDQPFEIVEENIGGISYPVFSQSPRSLRKLYHIALAHGDRDFMVYGDERWSYLETLEEARCFAWALRQDFNIRAGDHIAISCRNYPEWCVAYLAITGMGAVIAPLNSWWKRDELLYAIGDCKPNLVIVDEQRCGYIKDDLAKLSLEAVVIRPDGALPARCHDYKSLFTDRSDDGWPEGDISLDGPATIFYTSGSTSQPKGVLSTARAIITNLMTWALIGTGIKVADGLDPQAPVTNLGTLVCLPLFHITGCNSLFLLSLLTGRKIVFIDKWDPAQALGLIESEKLTHFTGVPTMSYELLHYPDRDKYDLSSLVDIGAGGAARPANQVAEIHEAFGTDLTIGYGMTETNALGTLITRASYLEKPASVGQPNNPIVSIKIIDEKGHPCKNGSVGEITIKSASNMQEYWNNPTATTDALRDGWLYTGDLGYLDEDDFLFITDRKKNLIISGGENISPQEVENALQTIDGVLNACVFSLPDERLGEIIGTLIHVTEDAQDNNAILATLRTKLANFKIPSHMWRQFETLPIIGSEKTDRQGIKNHYVAILSE